MRPIWFAMPVLLVLGCSSPKVVPGRVDEHFQLTMIKDKRIAVWPIPSAELDESISGTVTKEYTSQNKFLDALSAKFSTGLIRICRDTSLDSDKVSSLLNLSEATRGFLDPAKVLGTADPNNRFAPAPDLTSLSKIEGLQGVKYAILFRDLGLGRKWNHSGGGGGAYASNGAGGGMFIGGGSSSAKSNARLRLVVVDMESKSVVWDGAVFAEASSSFMKATALHEIEDDLITHFVNGVLGIQQ